MTQTLFKHFNDRLVKEFGKPASQQTFDAFAKYCAQGKEIDGVGINFNWVNLYAFGNKITTDEAEKIRLQNLREIYGKTNRN